MALGVNQTFKNYYTVRLGSLTTQHQVQSNRVTLFTNEITDIASKINFFENQKVLTLATPDNSKLAISADYFALPAGFDPSNANTWGSTINGSNTSNHPYYTTPCQKQLFIYKKLNPGDPDYPTLDAQGKVTATKFSDSTSTNYYYAGNFEAINGQFYAKIPYEKDSTTGELNGGQAAGNPNAGSDANSITDSRVLSNRLMTGEFIFVYTNDTGVKQQVGYKDLTFITESQDKTAFQETVQELESQRSNINNMQKKIQSEMQTTEVQIQAIQSMMESTDKVLAKNTETFKWGA